MMYKYVFNYYFNETMDYELRIKNEFKSLMKHLEINESRMMRLDGIKKIKEYEIYQICKLNVVTERKPFNTLKNKKITASEYVKKAGIKNLKEITEKTGQSAQTLNNWFNNKPELFKIIIKGCKT